MDGRFGTLLSLLIALAPCRAWADVMPTAPVPRAMAGPCQAAIAAAERATGVPDRLMQAIAVVESGRRDSEGRVAPWPWTIDVEGVPAVFDGKPAAIAAVQAYQAAGIRSIDVGCMQMNLIHHPDAFASLEDAFDPVANARAAARFLLQLLAQTGSWPRAVAGYHSLTPSVGAEYARKVLAVWAEPDLGFATTAQRTEAPPASPAALRPLPAASTARILPLPERQVIGMTGRSLQSYRASPTRGASLAFRHS